MYLVSLSERKKIIILKPMGIFEINILPIEV